MNVVASEVSGGRRARKKLALRRAISDIATALFVERGFEAVTLADVGQAADVATKTILNHFGTKEELFFDREAEQTAALCQAVRERPPGKSVVTALRHHSRQVLERLTRAETEAARAQAVGFWRTIEHSPTLRRWEHELGQRQADALVAALADEFGRPADDLLLQVLVGACLSVVRGVVLQLRRRLLAGEPPSRLRAELQPALERGFDLVEHGMGHIGTGHDGVLAPRRSRSAHAP